MSLPGRALHSFFSAGRGNESLKGSHRAAHSTACTGGQQSSFFARRTVARARASAPADQTPPPATCTPASAASAGTFRFAVFGDVRPAQENDTANYPKDIVTGLFTQIAAQSPNFVVGTGDYMFAGSTNSTAVDAQLAMLLDAEKGFAGPIYHALGNHECTGATASNCPNGNETANVRALHVQARPRRDHHALLPRRRRHRRRHRQDSRRRRQRLEPDAGGVARDAARQSDRLHLRRAARSGLGDPDQRRRRLRGHRQAITR